MKKIFAITTVRNEGDIIESFCRYNLTYCDGLLLYERESSDNTRAIIEKLIAEGLPIILEYDPSIVYSENRDLIDIMAQRVIDEFGADLVVPLDADEFLYHIDGINPRETLEGLREDVEYRALWRTYIYEKEPTVELGFLPNNFTHYRNPTLELHTKVLVGRPLINEKRASIAPGKHFLTYPNGGNTETVTVEKLPNLVYAHFPLRSKPQIMSKSIPNWIHKWKTPFPIRNLS